MKSMEASSFIFQLNEEEFYESHTMETEPFTFQMSLKDTKNEILPTEATSLSRYEYLHVQIVHAHIDPTSALQYNRIYHMDRLKANKAEIDQQRNESRTLDMNQIEVEIHLYTLNGKLDIQSVHDHIDLPSVLHIYIERLCSRCMEWSVQLL